ncbi:MAG: ABC transporter ATP-binding protein, partial [Aggregatilineales bacterium]
MILELHNVGVVYKRRGRLPVRAVAGVDLTLIAGAIVGLVGESGSGKSTLGRVAVGLTPVTTGSVEFNGVRLEPIGSKRRSRRELAVQMVFQNPFGSLNPRRRVGTQIADGMSLSSVPRSQRSERVHELLEQLGLPKEAARDFPHQFSGGQRQRIAIARALAVSPSVLVLDEPFASLDASAQAQLANVLQELAASRDIAMLLISHDLAIVRHIAKSVVVMYLGLVVEEAPTDHLWRIPLHPYTEALIAAIPRPNGLGELPIALPGEVGDPASPPPGCRFHTRCSYAF